MFDESLNPKKKIKISLTIDEDILKNVDAECKKRRPRIPRNRLIEYACKQFLDTQKPSPKQKAKR